MLKELDRQRNYQSMTKSVGTKMRALFFFLIILLSVSSLAKDLNFSKEECMNAYRNGYTTLKEHVDHYNNSLFIDELELSRGFSDNLLEVSEYFSSCREHEVGQDDDCVRRYKALHRELQYRVDISAVLRLEMPIITYDKKINAAKLIALDRQCK